MTMKDADQLHFWQPAQLISLSFPIVFLTFQSKDDVDSGHLDSSRGGSARAREVVVYCSHSQSSTRHAEAAATAPAAPGSLQRGRL